MDVSSSNIVLDLNPNSKTFGYQDLDVTVSTNYEAGYILSMSTADNSTDLKRDASLDSINASINTLGSSYTDTNFSNCLDTDTNCMNKWGYKNGLSSTNYLPFASPVSPILSSTTATNGDTTTLRFAAKINYNQPAGTYNNELIFTATANPITYNITYYDLVGIDDGTDPDKRNDGGLTWNNPTTGTAKVASYEQIAEQSNTSGTSSYVNLNPSYISGHSTPTRHTYTFAGWCLDTTNPTSRSVNNTIVATQDSNNKVTTYHNPSTQCNGTVYQTGDPTPLTPNDANNISIYAMWTPTTFAEAGVTAGSTMQTMTATKCANTSPNQFTTMTDSRDNGANTYTIIKLLDGRCWMADNLNIDLYNVTLANLQGRTNATNTQLGYLKNGGGTTSDQYAVSGVNSNTTYASGGDWTASYSYSDPLINKSSKCDPAKNNSHQCLSPYQDASHTTTTLVDKYGIPASDSSGVADIIYNFGPGNYRIGVRYNYCAASAGTYCWGNGTSYGSHTESAGYNTTADICPANWKLPTGGDGGDIQKLYNKIAGTNSTTGITTAPSSATNLLAFQTLLSTPVSGYYNSGTILNQGTQGDISSSTYQSAPRMYHLNFRGTVVNLLYTAYRYDGISVRCIAQN